jgi:hypothetical protein
MFRHHLTQPSACVAHLRAATEVALLVAALGFAGALSTHRTGVPESSGQPCVHLGRAGGICDARKPDAERNCLHLGRAGRFCAPSGR